MRTKTHEEMHTELVAKAAADENFRQRLVSDPKAAIQETFGIEVPDPMSITVHEESTTQAHLVLPPESSLSEADLSVVAGGDPSGYGVRPYHRHGTGPMH